MKKHLLLILTFITVSGAAMAQSSEIFAPGGKAIHGYDVVSFHTEGRAVPGKTEWSMKWKEADWLFSNQANLDSFKLSPEKYAPQYGGYCAFGMARGYKAPTAIDTWTIVDSKLYFNFNLQVKNKWSEDKPGMIAKADKNWQNVKSK